MPLSLSRRSQAQDPRSHSALRASEPPPQENAESACANSRFGPGRAASALARCSLCACAVQPLRRRRRRLILSAACD